MSTVDVRTELLRCAQALRPVRARFVSVVHLARELGTAVVIQLHATTNPSSAQLDLQARPPKILLYRRGDINGEREIEPWDENLLSARERFSIAHELGHWILFSRFRILPQSDKRTYWDHERAINAFANHLLVPDWLVEFWLEGVRDGKPVPPDALRHWAIFDSHTSEDVIANALTRRRTTIGFLKLMATRSRDGREVLSVLCSTAGEALQLPREKSHIDAPQLCKLLKVEKGESSLTHFRLARCEPQNLRVAWRHANAINGKQVIWLSLAIQDASQPPEEIPQQLEIELG